MLGFGELVAHETAWRLGWGGTKVGLSSIFAAELSAGVDWIAVHHRMEDQNEHTCFGHQ